jgi:flagellar hook-basal body complex protein FliE
MSVGAIGGANAYANMMKIMQNKTASISSGNVTGSTGSVTGSSGSTFSNFVADAAKGALNTIKNSENVSAQAIAGKASLTDVVTAVNSADVALKSIVAIRDKAIAAYQDIIKMPI